MTNAIIHIGCDKAGSSSIQYFLGRNQPALKTQRYRLIETTFARAGGHPYLFRDIDNPAWKDAQAEIEEYKSGIDTFLLTWEGAHHLKHDQLLKLKHYLKDMKVRFIYYIREQAELIQSGLLQRVKQDKLQDLDFLHVELDNHHLYPPSRNYETIIQRFERVFGDGCVDVRVFEHKRLVGGDAKSDFLDAIGITDTSDFVDYGDLNESLWVEAGVAIQMLDAIAPSPRDRRSLRDAGIAVSSRRKGSKYFLDSEHIDNIRAYFAESNVRVARRYLGREDAFHLKQAHRNQPLDRAAIADFTHEILSIWPRYPTAWSRCSARMLLAPVDCTTLGWTFDNDIARLNDEVGALRLHFSPRSRFPGQTHGTVKIETRNGKGRIVRVRHNGEELGDLNIPNDRIRIPIERLEPYATLDLTIEPIDEAGPLEITSFYVAYV